MYSRRPVRFSWLIVDLLHVFSMYHFNHKGKILPMLVITPMFASSKWGIGKIEKTFRRVETREKHIVSGSFVCLSFRIFLRLYNDIPNDGCDRYPHAYHHNQSGCKSHVYIQPQYNYDSYFIANLFTGKYSPICHHLRREPE